MTSLNWKETFRANIVTAQIDPSTWFELSHQPNDTYVLWVCRRYPKRRGSKKGLRKILFVLTDVNKAKAYAELFLASPWAMEEAGL